MCGIDVALKQRGIVTTPFPLRIEEGEALGAGAGAADALVVDVATFAVLEVAEEALAGEVQDEELFFAVAAVFEDWAMALVFFRGVDDIPALCLLYTSPSPRD